MINEILYLRDEAEQKRKIDAIQQTMQEYIQTNPEITVFRFFLPSRQDIDVIRQAAATASLKTEKRIVLLYPGGIGREEQGDHPERSRDVDTNNKQATFSGEKLPGEHRFDKNGKEE